MRFSDKGLNCKTFGKNNKNQLSLCLNATSFADFKKQWLQGALTELIELRLDCLPFHLLMRWEKILKRNATFLLLSYRGEEKKQTRWRWLLFWEKRLKPRLVDFDGERPPRHLSPRRLLLSYHDYLSFSTLSIHLQKLQAACPNAAHYKIAVTTKNANESLELLRFQRDHRKVSLTVIGMGESASWTRIALPMLGSRWIYVASSSHSLAASGQIPLKDMHEIYHLPRSDNPAWIALLGYPVEQSRGHLFHNHLFSKAGAPLLYLKIPLKKEEAKHFLEQVSSFPFAGFSVTMPLKEHLLFWPLLSAEAAAIGALNTLYLRDGIWHGDNTDGRGAIKALLQKTVVKGARFFILGLGGTAKAIAYAALQAGASSVSLFCRQKEKGMPFATKWHCSLSSFDELPRHLEGGCDILVNATPLGMRGFPSHDPLDLRKVRVVLDAVSEPQTQLLASAKLQNCLVVSGKEMFEQQALLQAELWLANFKKNQKSGQLHQTAIHIPQTALLK